MKKFVVQILIITIVLAIASFVAAKVLPQWVSKTWPWLLLFFAGTNTALYSLFSKAREKKLSKFANYFMLATFLKLILYLFVILAYSFYNRIDAVPFILLFFVYYLIYTTFEVKTVSQK